MLHPLLNVSEFKFAKGLFEIPPCGRNMLFGLFKKHVLTKEGSAAGGK
jgi:hypothetical protein